jgi:hypothetical protein
MTMSILLKDALANPLKKLGFSKKSNSWYWANEEVILVVNLQKSRYGEQYFVNCGIALKSLGADGFPKEHLCDIRFRLSSVVPKEKREECDAVFDLEKVVLNDQERKAAVASFFEQYGLSLLIDCTSVTSINDAYKTGHLPEWTVSKRVADLLQL